MSSQLKSEQSLPISPLKTQHLAQNPKTNTPRKHHVDPFAIPQKHRVSLGRAVPGRHSPSQRWAPLSAHCCRAALAHVAPRDPRVGTAGCTPTGGGPHGPTSAEGVQSTSWRQSGRRPPLGQC